MNVEQENSKRAYLHLVTLGINQKVLCSMAETITTFLPLERIDSTEWILSLNHLQAACETQQNF